MRPCNASPVRVQELHPPLLAFLPDAHIGQPSISMRKALPNHENAMSRLQSQLNVGAADHSRSKLCSLSKMR